MTLPFHPRPVTRASMTPGELYIWHIADERYAIVRLSATEDSIEKLDGRGPDEWLFKDKLIGHLYGPLSLRAS